MERIKTLYKGLLLGLLVILSPSMAFSQRYDILGRSELMVHGGGMNYIGDLNNQSAYGDIHWAAGGGIRVKLDNRWSVRIEGNYGTISAKKDWIPERNLSFRSRITEGALLVEFNFRPYGAGATDYQWTPYIFGGIAAFHFNPQALYCNTHGDTLWVDLQPLCTEGQSTTAYPERRPYPLTQINMPFGVGVKWRINKTFSIAAEYGFRRTWTDYLDDVSTTYVGAELLQKEIENGIVASQLADRSSIPNAPGIKRGDDSLNDWYSHFNISIAINMETLFGWMKSKKCRN